VRDNRHHRLIMFRPFAEWLANSSLSIVFQNNNAWIVPISQSIHIVCICFLFTSVITINARLLRARTPGRSISDLVNTLLPIIWWSVAGLALTGLIQTITEPVRQFVAPLFWTKMLLILIAVLLTASFAGRVRANMGRWDNADQRPQSAKTFAIATSLLWVAIVVCGRFIGYTWSFYA
jgi:hypothetical protein